LIKRTIFKCIDAHTAGNPVRVITSPAPKLNGSNMMEKRTHFLKDFDWIRKGLMFEPRGHDMMSGSIFYKPCDLSNDVGVIFIETSGCLPMCGHGLIGTVTVLIEENLVSPKVSGQLRVETPAGLIIVSYKKEKSKVTSVKFKNVPSYLAIKDLEVSCPDLGVLKIDVAYGGNFYGIIDIQDNFKGIETYSAAKLIEWSRVLRKKINSFNKLEHPENSKINSCSHILWTGIPNKEKGTEINAVFYGENAIDRSPCGTGTSARMAQWFTKGRLRLGESLLHESIIGSTFKGRIEKIIKLGPYVGIIPSIEGTANIIGYNAIIIDPKDSYSMGFQVI